MPASVAILRWALGIGSLVALALFLLILVVGKGFEAFRSGSGSGNPVRELAVVAIPLLLAAILASVLAPRATILLHVLAAAVLLAFAALIPVVEEHPGEGLLYLGFLGLWLLYYLLVVWPSTPMATFGYVLAAAAVPAVLWFGWEFSEMTRRPAETTSQTGLPAVAAAGASGLMLGVSLALLALSGLLIWYGRARHQP